MAMNIALLRLVLSALFVLSACARLSERSHSSSQYSHARRSLSTSPNLVNRTLPWGDDAQELVRRDGQKYVFMHHVRSYMTWKCQYFGLTALLADRRKCVLPEPNPSRLSRLILLARVSVY